MLTPRSQYEKPQISILIMHSYVWVIPITLFLSSHLARPVRREYFYWEKQVTLEQANQLVPVCPGLFHFLTPNVPCPGNLFSPEQIRVVSHSAMDHGAFDVLKQAFVCPHGGRQTGIKWASISQTTSSFLGKPPDFPTISWSQEEFSPPLARQQSLEIILEYSIYYHSSSNHFLRRSPDSFLLANAS